MTSLRYVIGVPPAARRQILAERLLRRARAEENSLLGAQNVRSIEMDSLGRRVGRTAPLEEESVDLPPSSFSVNSFSIWVGISALAFWAATEKARTFLEVPKDR